MLQFADNTKFVHCVAARVCTYGLASGAWTVGPIGLMGTKRLVGTKSNPDLSSNVRKTHQVAGIHCYH
jgi:hypothetical protein